MIIKFFQQEFKRFYQYLKYEREKQKYLKHSCIYSSDFRDGQ